MPQKSKNVRFPVSRIKKIMQADEDVGKIASAVPPMISKGLELFLKDLIDAAVDEVRKSATEADQPSSMEKNDTEGVSKHIGTEETVGQTLDMEVAPKEQASRLERSAKKKINYKLDDLNDFPDQEDTEDEYSENISEGTEDEASLRTDTQTPKSRKSAPHLMLANAHLKRCIEKNEKFDFLRNLVKDISDEVPKHSKKTRSIQASSSKSQKSTSGKKSLGRSKKRKMDETPSAPPLNGRQINMNSIESDEPTSPLKLDSHLPSLDHHPSFPSLKPNSHPDAFEIGKEITSETDLNPASRAPSNDLLLPSFFTSLPDSQASLNQSSRVEKPLASEMEPGTLSSAVTDIQNIGQSSWKRKAEDDDYGDI